MSGALTDINIHWGDILVIAIYFLLSLAIGIWTACRPTRNSVKGFFLAGRNMVWWPIGMSLFASNIGANTFVGTAGTAAASGYAVIQFEWNAVFLLILLGWVFLPVYIASGIYTMPEYLHKRLGGNRLRIYLSIIALFTYLFSTLSPDLYTGAIFLQQTVGLPIWIGVVAMLGIGAVYTAMGGLTTVILTDALAVVIMVIGGFILCIIGLVQIGGFEALEHRYMTAVPEYTYRVRNTTCGFPRDDSFHIFRSLDADYPWFGTMGRSLLGGMWYWCANQVLVQRALAAKNMTHAKAGCIFAAYLKLTPLFIIVIPGMISRAFFPDDIACVDRETCERVCENPLGCTNIAYPKIVVELLPAGLRGLIIAVMLAAVISSLTSVFNSASTLFAMDIWGRIRPRAGERETLFVSKVFIVALSAASAAWIPVMATAQGGEIYKYTSTITGYFGGPTTAMFLVAIFWSRVTEPGAFWGMILSQSFGILRFILDFVYPSPACGEMDDRPFIVKDIHGYDYTIMQISLGFIAIFVISVLTKPPNKKQIVGLTFGTRFDKPDDCDDKNLCLINKGETGTENDTGNSIKQFSSNQNMEQIDGYGSDTSEGSRGGNSDEETQGQDDFETRMAFLNESRFWKIFMNINAIVVATITIFLYGFFY